MSKIYQFIVMLILAPIGIMAQYSQGFEANGNVPSDWTIINNGSTSTWKIYTVGAFGPFPHSGYYFIGLPSSSNQSDYLISPGINIVAGVSDKLTFWARNNGGDASKDMFDLLVSQTTSTPDAFQVLESGIKPPLGVGLNWKQYTYDLTAYIGKTIYIAFYVNTATTGTLALDDFEVSANALSTSETNMEKASIYPNPVKDILHVKNKIVISDMTVYDISGRMIKKENINSANAAINVSDLETGNYLIKLKDKQTEKSYKIIKK